MPRFHLRYKVDLRWKRLAFDRQIERARRNCAKAATHITKKIKQKVSIPWGGTPSSPGEAPRLRTGNLRDSIETRTVSRTNKEVTWKVSVTYYGEYLEFGTSKMAARPFINVTLTEEYNNILSILKEI